MIRFKITDFYFLKDRGAFIIGAHLEGNLSLGLTVKGKFRFFMIMGIENAYNSKRDIHHTSIIFSEKPSMDEIIENFTIGDTLEIEL